MPHLRSIHPPVFDVTQPGAKNLEDLKCSIDRYYPGRNVSVQFGLAPPNGGSAIDLRVRIVLLPKAGSTPPHDVSFAQIRGPALIVIGAGHPVRVEAFSKERPITLFVEARFVRETASSEIAGITVGALEDISHRDALISQLAGILDTLSQREQPPSSVYVESLGTVMAAHVLHHFFNGEAPADRRRGLPTEAFQRVVKYVDEHYAEEFDADALARIAGYSRNHFQRLFKKSFDQTPREYVRACQVEHAIALLQTTNSKGLDVALACGFCDETQMARWFWKLRRCLPSHVREANRG